MNRSPRARLSELPASLLLESRAATAAATSVLRGLRILAYHDVPDASTFEAQMSHIAGRFRPVDGATVARWLTGEFELPDRAVWVTFDDGYAGVVTKGARILDRTGVPATLFVCPAVVGTTTHLWWHVAEAAAERGLQVKVAGQLWGGSDLVSRLKVTPDTLRRTVIDELCDRLAPLAGPSYATVTQLRSWLTSGHEVGNHTWDHPCLDQCSEEEQVRQIRRAHNWLRQELAITPQLFAYPNGNWAAHTEVELQRLDYALALGFDHRRATAGSHPLRVSRIRVDARTPLARFQSMVSGLHPLAHHLRTALRPLAADRPRVLPG